MMGRQVDGERVVVYEVDEADVDRSYFEEDIDSTDAALVEALDQLAEDIWNRELEFVHSLSVSYLPELGVVSLTVVAPRVA